MSRRPSLVILKKYRDHQLQQKQIQLQEKIAEERLQQRRLIDLETQLRETHATKMQAVTVGDLIKHDHAASFVQSHKVQTSRELGLARLAQEEALHKTLKAKKAKDQISILLENAQRLDQRKLDQNERQQLDDISTGRYPQDREELSS